MIIEIFGQNVQIIIENPKIESILKEQLSIYPNGNDKNFDVVIKIVNDLRIDDENYSNSPGIHKTYSHGFLSVYKSSKIYFRKTSILEIFLELNSKETFIRKFLNMGFKNNIENIGQLIHELVFIPMVFFDNNKSIIHASSMKNNSTNKTIMFGGTGGVGKTSLELLLCRDLDYSFISDDIAIVSDSNSIYPNLSYPKIYAYNVANNNEIKKLLFKNKTMVDKFQWELISRYRGLSGVRRAISPKEIFNSVEEKENKIDEYYILLKTNLVKDIEFEEINYEKASKLTLDVIKNEYQTILQHIIWHDYNANIMEIKPIITIDKLYSKWFELYLHIFKDINSYVIKIPTDICHKDFLEQMKSRFV